MRNDYAPEAAGLEWVAQAACAGMDPDLFFVEAGMIIDEAVLDVCRRCPVRAECLGYAYSRNFSSGYFGGFSPGQRRNHTLAAALAAIAAEDAARTEAARAAVATAVTDGDAEEG